jgi:hypothetical protein
MKIISGKNGSLDHISFEYPFTVHSHRKVINEKFLSNNEKYPALVPIESLM